MPYKGLGAGYDQISFKKRLIKEDRRRLKCSHCQENGHEAYKYFKLHGYPDSYKRFRENRDDEKINYMEKEDLRSEGGRNYGSEVHQDMPKIIQSEVARCLSQLT